MKCLLFGVCHGTLRVCKSEFTFIKLEDALTDIIPATEIDRNALISPFAGELSPSSRRIYAHDAEVFAHWLQFHQVTPETITEETMSAYRGYLLEHYRTATAKRMFSVSCRLLGVQVGRKILKSNPAANVRGIKAEDESPHIALGREQAKTLLESINTSTLKGKRDYAMISTLLYTGIRRFECAALTIGDMSMEQGHHILMIKGKGNRRDIVKLRVEAWRAIKDYLEATKRDTLGKSAPLFCQFHKGDMVVESSISSNVVYRTVIHYAELAKIDKLKPHGMRATFVTLSLEGGAKLEQVQYAARHKDPRTTERYWRRKLNLDDNAVDHIHL